MKRTHNVLAAAIILFILASFSIALTGCGEDSQRPSSSSRVTALNATEAVEDESGIDIPVIGQGDCVINVTNETGYEITGISIKPTNETDYSSQNSFMDFIFTNGQTVCLAFTEDASATTYDIMLMTSEDSKIAIRGLDLSIAENLVFHFEEGFGYATYTNAITGETEDTQTLARELDNSDAVITYDSIHQRG